MAAYDLAVLGWTLDREQAFAPLARTGLVPGRVSLEHNHVYRVLTAAEELLAEAAGRIKYLASGRHELPAVGDWVGVRVDPRGGRSVIRAILPRRSVFSRKAAGRETTEQVVAANVDTVFVVFGLDKPVNTNSIERYLVLARRSGADPVIVLNKADLSDDVAGCVTDATVAAGDVPVHAVSTREAPGVSRLASHLAVGRTVALIGPSGAGKSSIVNTLVERELLATGEVRDWDARGRHTTVHRQLVVRDAGGLIIDTPGLRELQLWDAGDAFDDAFTDIAALAHACRFRDCRHDQEPGCAVKAAVDSGTLDAGRYESYLKLQREQAAFEKNRDVRAGIEAKRQGKLGSKAYKALQKQRGR
jgi:ribosome biogenesis GTPase / thiamine phosphate phosphatase